jgi:hypothetical protein
LTRFPVGISFEAHLVDWLDGCGEQIPRARKEEVGSDRDREGRSDRDRDRDREQEGEREWAAGEVATPEQLVSRPDMVHLDRGGTDLGKPSVLTVSTDV